MLKLTCKGMYEEMARKDEFDFASIERTALDYIKREQKMVVLSGIFPIVLFFFGFLSLDVAYRWLEFYEVPVTAGFAQITPIIITFIFAGLAFGEFYFFILWHRHTIQYEKVRSQVKLVNVPEEQIGADLPIGSKKQATLSTLIYNFVQYMTKMKYLFILILLVGAINLSWDGWFLFDSEMYHKFWIPEAYFMPLLWLILINVAIIVIFLLFEGYLFAKWQIRLKRLRQYEKEVLQELGLD